MRDLSVPELPLFVPFPKIARLNRMVYVTEKIDGTNAQIHIGEDYTVTAGSRTRWITPNDDNFGFARWVADHANELRELGPGSHFGEWWGSGIQRGYGLQKGEKRFSLFNTARWSDEKGSRPHCCHVVPLLAVGLDIRQETSVALSHLRTTGSVAAPGFAKPEGVVIFHSAAQQLFKVTLEKDDAPKGQP